MPSETIYAPSVHVRVAWGSNHEGTIQVATLASSQEHPNEATDRLIAIVNQWLIEAGQPVIDMKALREKLAYTPEFDGWHAILDDWAEANRLIKVLKRARDQAFGSPE
jgi:hypothetical protein